METNPTSRQGKPDDSSAGPSTKFSFPTFKIVEARRIVMPPSKSEPDHNQDRALLEYQELADQLVTVMGMISAACPPPNGDEKNEAQAVVAALRKVARNPDSDTFKCPSLPNCGLSEECARVLARYKEVSRYLKERMSPEAYEKQLRVKEKKGGWKAAMGKGLVAALLGVALGAGGFYLGKKSHGVTNGAPAAKNDEAALAAKNILDKLGIEDPEAFTRDVLSGKHQHTRTWREIYYRNLQSGSPYTWWKNRRVDSREALVNPIKDAVHKILQGDRHGKYSVSIF